MTDSPVAAANARTMWKREIPTTPAISSRVSSPARWLSINQSAFWAGFMDLGLHSKPAHYDRLPRAAFDSPCSRSPFRETGTRLVIATSKATKQSTPNLGSGLLRGAGHRARIRATRWLAMTILAVSSIISFRAVPGRRCSIFRRRCGLLLVVGRLLLRGLQLVHDLLQGSDGAFQVLDLPVRGIELLLMVGRKFCNCLLQEIDIALQATGPPLHGLFDGADLDAGNVLRWRISGCQQRSRQGSRDDESEPADHGNPRLSVAYHAKLRGASAGRERYHTET